MDVHDNDDSESSQPSWGKLWEVRYSTSLSMLCVKYSAYLRRIVADILHDTKDPSWSNKQKLSRPVGSRDIFSIGSDLVDFILFVYVLVRTLLVILYVRTRNDIIGLAEIEEFHYEAYMAHSNTNAHLRHYKKILLAFKSRYVEGLNKFLTNLNTVHEAVKEDPALNVKVLVATHAYVNNSSNLT
ncbi:hypothetical protein Tco_0546027 [Tanacetum coccineum]